MNWMMRLLPDFAVGQIRDYPTLIRIRMPADSMSKVFETFLSDRRNLLMRRTSVGDLD